MSYVVVYFFTSHNVHFLQINIVVMAAVTDAETGLNTVNGFLMRGKPVVMSYGRAHK